MKTATTILAVLAASCVVALVAWAIVDFEARRAAKAERLEFSYCRPEGSRLLLGGAVGEFVAESPAACAQVAAVWGWGVFAEKLDAKTARRPVAVSITISVTWYKRTWPLGERVILGAGMDSGVWRVK